MDAGTIVSLCLSAVAVVMSAYTNARSVKATRDSQSLAVVKDIFAQRHQPEFEEAFDAVRGGDFLVDVDCSRGVAGLPSVKQGQANRLIVFYDDLGKLVAHKIIGEDLIIGSYGFGIVWVWEVLAPLIMAERSIRGTNYNIYFEDLAERAKRNPPMAVHRRLGLAAQSSWRRRSRTGFKTR